MKLSEIRTNLFTVVGWKGKENPSKILFQISSFLAVTFAKGYSLTRSDNYISKIKHSLANKNGKIRMKFASHLSNFSNYTLTVWFVSRALISQALYNVPKNFLVLVFARHHHKQEQLDQTQYFRRIHILYEGCVCWIRASYKHAVGSDSSFKHIRIMFCCSSDKVQVS